MNGWFYVLLLPKESGFPFIFGNRKDGLYWPYWKVGGRNLSLCVANGKTLDLQQQQLPSQQLLSWCQECWKGLCSNDGFVS